MTQTNYSRQWRLFGNGLLQAIYSGLIVSFGMVVADGWFSLGMNAKQFTASVAVTVLGYVIGWARNNGLPPVFQIDDVDVKTLTEVAKVVEVADAKIAKIADTATADIADVVADAPKKDTP